MNWIKQIDREPTIKDLPFVTWDGKFIEFWEDSDWFSELTDDDKAERPSWMPLINPEQKTSPSHCKELQCPVSELEQIRMGGCEMCNHFK